MSPRTTDVWARALTDTLTTSADTPTLNTARRLLAAARPQLNVNKGFATAKFTLPDGRPARARLLVEELTAAQWERIETAITTRTPTTSTIGDDLADPHHTAGIPLLPSARDLSHHCTCTQAPAGDPCAHTLAVGLLLAERLRTAPAPLFTLRGRPYQHIKKRLRDGELTTVAAGPAPASVPFPAAPPLARPVTDPTPVIPAQQPASMPEPADLDLTTARPVLAGPLPEPPAPLPALSAQQALVADAAHRARALLTGTEQPTGPDTGSDLARFTALEHGAPFRQAAMDHLALDVVAMGHLTLAHAHGGTAGAATYLHRYTLDHDVLARAQADIQPLRPAPNATVECEDNHLTDPAAGIQLRYGPDGRWHPYLAPYGTWQPVPGPAADPADAYRSARTAARAHRRTR
ncbi:hypothetical protein [Streptomyces mutabilis]|uniref:SWIM-type domain-containing protein n=1 Tax=Streptomyces mutabilis TaxID=67332 RepID=A0A086MRE0_9ACTN|nr:hypothetical protein [Streptomyces mutabilis]KFG71458.1 hypothetical protein FM21_34935 [Streptomyces mutabilis]